MLVVSVTKEELYHRLFWKHFVKHNPLPHLHQH